MTSGCDCCEAKVRAMTPAGSFRASLCTFPLQEAAGRTLFQDRSLSVRRSTVPLCGAALAAAGGARHEGLFQKCS